MCLLACFGCDGCVIQMTLFEQVFADIRQQDTVNRVLVLSPVELFGDHEVIGYNTGNIPGADTDCVLFNCLDHLFTGD